MRTDLQMLVRLVVIIALPAAMANGQQAPSNNYPSPPPPVSFGDSAERPSPQLATGEIITSPPAADDSAYSARPTVSQPLSPQSAPLRGSDVELQSDTNTWAEVPAVPPFAVQGPMPIQVVAETPASARANWDAFGEQQAQASGAATGMDSKPPVYYRDSATQPAIHLSGNSFTSAINPMEQVLAAFDVRQWPRTLPGQPVSLESVLNRTAVEQRLTMIHSYWEAFDRWARFAIAQVEADQLSELRSPSSTIEQDLLSGAMSLAQSRLIEAQHQLTAAQRGLSRSSPSTEPEQLPLPENLPLADEYVTHFSVFAQRGMFDPRLGQIDARLPQTLQVIQSRATASAKCRTVAAQAIQAFNQNQLPLASALEAIRMCRECDSEFIRAIGEYNRDVADYALAVAPFGQPVQQVVGMLIKPSATSDTGPRMASNLTAVPREPQSVLAPTMAPTQTPASFGSPAATTQPGNWDFAPQANSAPETRQSPAAPFAPSNSILSTTPPMGNNSSNQGPPPALGTSANTPLRPQTSGGGQFILEKR